MKRMRSLRPRSITITEPRLLSTLRTGRTRLMFVDIYQTMWRRRMTWTTPTLVEIYIGLEINGCLPAEF